jgi:hypothetical protein
MFLFSNVTGASIDKDMINTIVIASKMYTLVFLSKVEQMDT